jgi:hypothetical protein
MYEKDGLTRVKLVERRWEGSADEKRGTRERGRKVTYAEPADDKRTKGVGGRGTGVDDEDERDKEPGHRRLGKDCGKEELEAKTPKGKGMRHGPTQVASQTCFQFILVETSPVYKGNGNQASASL